MFANLIGIGSYTPASATPRPVGLPLIEGNIRVERLVRAAHVVWRDVQARGVDPVVFARALRRRPGAVAAGSAP